MVRSKNGKNNFIGDTSKNLFHLGFPTRKWTTVRVIWKASPHTITIFLLIVSTYLLTINKSEETDSLFYIDDQIHYKVHSSQCLNDSITFIEGGHTMDQKSIFIWSDATLLLH